MHRVAVAGENHLLLGAQGVPERPGSGMGVAVLVAADPGAEPEEGVEGRRWPAEDLGPAPIQWPARPRG